MSIEQVLRAVREQQARLADMERERAAIAVVGHSADELVNVTLDHRMKVTGLDIDGRAMRMTSFQLAEAIQDALEAAYGEWEARTAELMNQVIGDPDLVRGAAAGSVSATDWFRRFGVDLEGMFGAPGR